MSKKQTYKCPKCGNEVVLYISPSETPVCSHANHEWAVQKPVKMEVV